ncbi:hypothetical protein Cni_G10818 [Canna indica]|uniref:Uncharacterized protein n=1 Tax=Canna indica TaxID=4628 RepID=A0AAQ3Q8X7_9LILI|nr:hypothetical protein Cni_G10818 [Canna indica]
MHASHVNHAKVAWFDPMALSNLMHAPINTPRDPPCPVFHFHGRLTMSSTQASATIESQREGAEVYQGAELCKKKSVELLGELRLPKGLLPLSGIEEVGYNRGTGFVWLKQKKATNHVFRRVGKAVTYAAEVMAFVEDRRMRRVSGVKSKELLIWVSISEMCVDGADPSKISFKTYSGLSKSFPVSAFEEDQE